MPRISIVLMAVLFALSACSKKHDSAPTNNNNTYKSPYYFRFTLVGKTDTVAGDTSNKSYSESTNAIFGELSPTPYSLRPAISLRFSMPVWYDTVTESDVLGLAGKTLYFTDSIMKPEVEYEENDTTDWLSDSYADSSYYVKVTGVTFLGSNTYQGHPVRNYVFTGTCRAKVWHGTGPYSPLDGSFNMIVTRVNYK